MTVSPRGFLCFRVNAQSPPSVDRFGREGGLSAPNFWTVLPTDPIEPSRGAKILSFASLVANAAGWQTRTMRIRDATPYDAIAGCKVLRRSIAELCTADHKNDPAILAR